MKELNLKISIAHLFPSSLNLYGDGANVLILKKRCEWRGIEVELDEVDSCDNLTEHDIYFIGSGTDEQMENISVELFGKRDLLLSERDKGSVFLGVCGGYQLLGKSFELSDGRCVQGVGLLDLNTVKGKKRFTGNVTAKVDFVEPNVLVGFENHNDLTYLEGDTKPLMNLSIGNGNNSMDKTEGARYKNVFGTYLHGPVLSKNSHFADYLIELALEKRYGRKIRLTQLNDDFEILSHNNLIEKTY